LGEYAQPSVPKFAEAQDMLEKEDSLSGRVIRRAQKQAH